MFELFKRSENDAIDMLKTDHDRVKELFERFEKTETSKEKKEIVDAALHELKLHAAVEEEIFYPSVRQKLEKQMMNEADEEHHVAKVLVAELEQMKGSEDHYEAKFIVLAENVRHHIKEEESEMLREARGLKLDFDRIGKLIQERKQELIKKGFPNVGEETMVSGARGRGDSPAQAARKTGLRRTKSDIPKRTSRKSTSKSKVA